MYQNVKHFILKNIRKILSVLIVFTIFFYLIYLNKQYYNESIEFEVVRRVNKILSRTKLIELKKMNVKFHQQNNDTGLPPIYIITATYRRPEQLAELTRLGYTLKHVKNLLWLVVEDTKIASPIVTKILKHIGVPFQHLIAPMPEKFKTKKAQPRGVSNRNRGLEWIRNNAYNHNNSNKGVLYFADDDNTYDVSIFEQIRYTKKVSMWPVGLVTRFGLSSPIVKNGQLIGFYDGRIYTRSFPVDMGGFAVSVEFLLTRPKAKMPFKVGYAEDGFLQSLALHYIDIEILANNCTEILVWHTQSKKYENPNPLNSQLRKSNIGTLRLMMVSRDLNKYPSYFEAKMAAILERTRKDLEASADYFLS